MRILMFSADPKILDATSGAAKRMIEYGKRLERLDIIVLERVSHASHGLVSLAENVTVYSKSGVFSRFYKGIFLAAKLLKKEKYDLLVAQDIEHAKMCCLLSFRFGTAWQMQIHSDIFSPYFVKHPRFNIKNWLRLKHAYFLIPRASCIRVVSERIKYQLARQWGRPKIEVLPILALPFLDQAEPKRFYEFEQTILVASRLTKEKNIELAIEAMAEVVKKHPKAGLIIVGDGPEREALKLQITNYKLQANVKLEGWQNNLVPYYKGADIFLLTSWYEGWGMSAVEAMRYGAAVVMTDVGLAGELIEDGTNGLVVPVNDKNALVGAILRFLENHNLRQDFVEAATQKVKELPPAEEYYNKIISHWKNCL